MIRRLGSRSRVRRVRDLDRRRGYRTVLHRILGLLAIRMFRPLWRLLTVRAVWTLVLLVGFLDLQWPTEVHSPCSVVDCGGFAFIDRP